MAFLEVDDIHTYYGNIQALKGVSIAVEEGECVTLIGSNGAGKSTTLRSISGLTPPRTGSIRVGGEPIEHLPPQEIVRLGVCQSPEGRKCFQRMTVRENLELGAFLRRDSQGIAKDLKRVFELFPRLEERESQKAGTMSGGEQQMLAIGRALMGNPQILLLDEPSMGISPILTERIYETIGARPSEGSSRSRRRGRAMSARPMASICCSPPDSDHPSCDVRSRRRGKSASTASRSAEMLSPRRRQALVATVRFSSTVRPGNTRRPSGTWASPKRTRASTPSPARLRPSSRMSPWRGRMRPEMLRSSVVFPAPFAPSSATTSPARTLSSTALKATTGP